MKIKRGDVVICVSPGDYGKPRPAVVIQSDFFSEHQSCSLLPLTSELYPARLFRIDIEPASDNGLDKASQVMVDKITSIAVVRIKQKIGRLSEEQMEKIEVALTVWLGL